MLNPLLLIVIVFVLAFLTESFVEYLAGTPFDKYPKLQPHKWLLMYVSVGVGILLAIYYRLDLIYLISQYVGVEWQPLADASIVGEIITGIGIGRGANFLHDLMKFVMEKKLYYQADNQYTEIARVALEDRINDVEGQD